MATHVTHNVGHPVDSDDNYRSRPTSHQEVPISSLLKGKQRASAPVDNRISMHGGEERRSQYRSTWIVDGESGMVGADAWVERDRVVLVLGRKLDRCA